MPRINITHEWLQARVAEMNRVVRNYADSTVVAAYWTRITEAVEAEQVKTREIRAGIERVSQYLTQTEIELDAKL